jgi:hypothetical protein
MLAGKQLFMFVVDDDSEFARRARFEILQTRGFELLPLDQRKITVRHLWSQDFFHVAFGELGTAAALVHTVDGLSLHMVNLRKPTGAGGQATYRLLVSQCRFQQALETISAEKVSVPTLYHVDLQLFYEFEAPDR